MKRIGIAASRIAQGNLFRYNFYVCLISCLVSFLIFMVSALTLVVGLWLVSLLTRSFLVVEPGTGFSAFLVIAVSVLAVVVGVVNLVAIAINIRTGK